MEIFVNNSQKVTVDVYAYELDDELQATTDQKEIPKEINSSDVEILKFIFRRPRYADSNQIMQDSKITTGSQDANAVVANAAGFQDSILRNLLDEVIQGEEVTKMKNREISNLHPNLARAAVSGLLDQVSI